MSHLALDLFAGAGGWDVAVDAMGHDSVGVEIMPEARATREMNGLSTAQQPDVWASDEFRHLGFDTLLASPPCQTYSQAGSGAGRRALDEVLAVCADETLVSDIALLRAESQRWGDERIGLVLSPLAYVHEHYPPFIALEQVPPVLPVWEAIGEQLRVLGYHVWVGLLQAEQYGVPQTRKRAVLIASSEHQVGQPTPTHSRYYPRDPQRRDADVLPWISMAEALGWGADARPSPTVTGGGKPSGPTRGGAEPFGNGARQALERDRIDGRWVLRTGVNSAILGPGPKRDAAMAEGRWRDVHKPQERDVDVPAPTVDSKVGTAWKVAMRSNYGTSGDPKNRGEREEDQPAPTMTSKANRNHWVQNRPSTTIVGSFRPEIVAAPGWRKPGDGPRQNAEGSVRITLEEAAALQSFPAGFGFAGSKGKQFLQVGNAVPPLLARAILEELWGER